MENAVYMIAAARTAVAPSGGSFKHLNYDSLAAGVIQHCLKEVGLSNAQVDELIVSNALGAGGNPARHVVLTAGLPKKIAGLSIDRQCVGGLDALLLGKALILSGQAQIVVAGGTESHSLRPKRYYKTVPENDYIYKDQAPFIPPLYADPLMEVAADQLAQKYGISQLEQDTWAIQSHAKALKAKEKLRQEIIKIAEAPIPYDSFTRNLTLETCQRAKAFSASITAANTSVAADGAAFVVLVSEAVYKSLSLKRALRIMDGETSGGNPELPGIAPIAVTKKLLERNRLTSVDIDAVELMEAYAVQAIVCANACGFSSEQINRSGGALSRGHPIGASGAILAVRLFYELERVHSLGLASIAGAGGIASGILFEKVM